MCLYVIKNKTNSERRQIMFNMVRERERVRDKERDGKEGKTLQK